MSRMMLTGLFAASAVLLVGQQLAARPMFWQAPAPDSAPAPTTANADSPADTQPNTPSGAPSDTATSLLAATQPGEATQRTPGHPLPA